MRAAKMRCKQCGRETGGIDAGSGELLAVCRDCLLEIVRPLGNALGAVEGLGSKLGDLGVSPDDEKRVSEATAGSPKRRGGWDCLPQSERLFIKAMAHVSELFANQDDVRFVELTEPVVACIKRCSRAVLFSTMGDCLERTLGDYHKLLHVMEIFGYEHFDYEEAPEPLASMLGTGSRNEIFSVLLESLDVLLGTNGMERIKALRAWNRSGGVGPHPNAKFHTANGNTDADVSDHNDDSDHQ
ncbi:MAG: hypothetical protein IIA33_04945 [Planctomycetes bacterium]|nr:hypothetical protein [Planctomycetota bacterium]